MSSAGDDFSTRTNTRGDAEGERVAQAPPTSLSSAEATGFKKVRSNTPDARGQIAPSSTPKLPSTDAPQQTAKPNRADVKTAERTRAPSDRDDDPATPALPGQQPATAADVNLNITAPVQELPSADRVETAQQIIAQMTSQIAQLQHTDRTETVVTLNHPPHFRGVQLIVTEFNSARGELNLTFANVQSPEAQKWLAESRNLHTLNTNLADLGYVVQRLDTTYQQDMRVDAGDPNAFGQSKEQQGDAQQHQQQQPKPQRLFAEGQDAP